MVFKKDEAGNKVPFEFKENNLVVSEVNCDQGLTPVDPEIERSLNESLSLNFKIENESQKQRAEAAAKKLKQEKEGELQRFQLKASIDHQKQMIELEKSRAETNRVKILGEAVSEAKAKAEADVIYYKHQLDKTEKIVKAKQIEQKNELDLLKREA